ncbi:MAG: hypothetical protein L0Z62_22085 [Gemmataceae bacterium]|nr:hypothetical protein [Gemmataceae bacterium]
MGALGLVEVTLRNGHREAQPGLILPEVERVYHPKERAGPVYRLEAWVRGWAHPPAQPDKA